MWIMTDTDRCHRGICCSNNSIRGYHVYKRIWSITIGEKLVCKSKISNVVDRHVVVFTKTVQLLVIFLKRLLKTVRCS